MDFILEHNASWFSLYIPSENQHSSSPKTHWGELRTLSTPNSECSWLFVSMWPCNKLVTCCKLPSTPRQLGLTPTTPVTLRAREAMIWNMNKCVTRCHNEWMGNGICRVCQTKHTRRQAQQRHSQFHDRKNTPQMIMIVFQANIETHIQRWPAGSLPQGIA